MSLSNAMLRYLSANPGGSRTSWRSNQLKECSIDCWSFPVLKVLKSESQKLGDSTSARNSR